jgi:hypothetical protein
MKRRGAFGAAWLTGCHLFDVWDCGDASIERERIEMDNERIEQRLKLHIENLIRAAQKIDEADLRGAKAILIREVARICHDSALQRL